MPPRSAFLPLLALLATTCSSGPPPKCQGQAKGCAAIESNAACESQLACYWTKAHCQGVRLVNCRILDGNKEDCEAVGCTYGRVEDWCEGKYNDVDCKYQHFDTERLCGLFGCEWRAGECEGRTAGCEELDTNLECSKQVGCEWK